ncbi:MAG: spermidine/putrescine ABC transporter [Myxococcales bacterium]
MKGRGILAVAVVVVVAAAVAAFFWTRGAGKRQLHVYNWADYMDPAVIAQFEKENDCEVVVDTFDSNEAMYARIKAGATGYDVVFPTSYMAAVMQAQGMLVTLDPGALPNLRHVDRSFTALTEDPEMRHSVPYLVSVTGIGYDAKKLGDLEPSWGVFGRADLAGRMTMLNDMREAIGAALKFLGYSYNSTNPEELARAKELLLSWKPNLARFDVDEAKRGLGSGEFQVVHGYNGDILQVIEENDAIAFTVPREGTAIASDNMAILKGAPEPALAHAFIDFLLRPDIAAKNMEHVQYRAPNVEAVKLVSQELRENPAVFLDPEILGKSEMIRDLGANNKLYTEVWDAVKGGK